MKIQIFKCNCWHIFSFMLEYPYLKILNYKMLLKGVDLMLFLGIIFGFLISALPYFIKENYKINQDFLNQKVKFQRK